MSRSIRIPALAAAAALVFVLVAGVVVLGATVFSHGGYGNG